VWIRKSLDKRSIIQSIVKKQILLTFQSIVLKMLDHAIPLCKSQVSNLVLKFQ